VPMLIKEVPSSYKELLGLFRESKEQALRTLYAMHYRRSYNEWTHPHYCVGCRNPYTDLYYWIETRFPKSTSDAAIKVSEVPVIFEAETYIDHVSYFIRLGLDYRVQSSALGQLAVPAYVGETCADGQPHQRYQFELGDAYRLWMNFCTLP
jgi:hypothetical protein